MTADPSTTHHAVTCLDCGCLCDDIRLQSNGRQIESVERACPQGEAWFQQRIQPATCLAEDSPVSLASAIATASQLLQEAERPLLYGFDQADNETVRASLALADRLGAAFDVSLSTTSRAVLRAEQSVGRLSATRGELKNSADLVIFIGCDPVSSHPRFLDRYVDRDRAKIIVIHDQPTATEAYADQVLTIDSGNRFDALGAWRSAVQFLDPPATAPACDRLPGNQNAWHALAVQMASSRTTALVYDQLSEDSIDEATLLLESIYGLARDASQKSRIFTIDLGSAGNSTGAVEATTWQTGFPPPVDFSAGYPRHCPLTRTADALLSAGACDLVMMIQTVAANLRLSATAMQNLREVAKIVISTELTTMPKTKLAIRTAATGIQSTGTVNRADNIALPLRPVIPTESPYCKDVIHRMLAQI